MAEENAIMPISEKLETLGKSLTVVSRNIKVLHWNYNDKDFIPTHLWLDEMFAEIRLQLQERGTAPNVTDVVSLDAELLGIETLDHEYMASVKFSGKIRESEGAVPEPFEEVWNLTRPISKKGGWVLAGIQQLS